MLGVEGGFVVRRYDGATKWGSVVVVVRGKRKRRWRLHR